jgi:hypothetical protein
MVKMPMLDYFPAFRHLYCKKRLAVFLSLAGMSLTKLSLAENNQIIPAQWRVWLATSRLGTGKWLTFFYSVLIRVYSILFHHQ